MTGRRLLPWPKRVDIALLCFIALVIAYCDRVNLSVAAPTLLREYGWDTGQMGWAFTGFFIGYTLFMIPAGRLTDRFGPRRMFALSIAWWSVFTALTPLPKSLVALTALRILMGAGESGTFPSINSALVRWFPKQEYSRATAFCWSGGYAGSIVGFPLATAILSLWGWQSVFYLFAGLGVVWLPLWWFGATDGPEASRAVTRQELEHILQARPELPKVESVPWKRLLRLRPLWAVWILHFSSNWFSYVMITWLPSYLTLERNFSLANMALGSALPFACALVGTNVFGMSIDRLSRNRDRTRVRKAFLAPYALSAATLLLVPVAPGPGETVVLLCAAMFLLTGATPVYASSSLDIAPRYAGTVVGIQSSVANLAGVLAPVIIGYLVKGYGWSSAFWLTAAVSTLGILVFLAFGRAEKLID
ncbi:MAG: ACS family MFS transporter [Acidobacteria bacterium]|nr:ACS family MFS transporter [Acidobacteriota bacterium]